MAEYRAPITTVTEGPITYTYPDIYPDYHFWPDYSPQLTSQGWECPKCGRVYAPWVMQCGHCGPWHTLTTSS